MSRRIEKINELLEQELSKLIFSEFAAKVGMVSINLVSVSADLKEAKIYIGLVGKKIMPKDIKYLQSKAYYLQNRLAKMLTMKFIPKLTFCVDQNQEEASKVEALLKKIETEKKGDY